MALGKPAVCWEGARDLQGAGWGGRAGSAAGSCGQRRLSEGESRSPCFTPSLSTLDPPILGTLSLLVDFMEYTGKKPGCLSEPRDCGPEINDRFCGASQ